MGRLQGHAHRQGFRQSHRVTQGEQCEKLLWFRLGIWIQDSREEEGHGNDGRPALGVWGGWVSPQLQPVPTRPTHAEPPVGTTGELNHQGMTDNGP